MKEAQIKAIQDWTEQHYKFQWENLYKLSKKELEFFMGILHKAYIQEKCLLKAVDYDVSKVEELIKSIIEEESLKVEESAFDVSDRD